jgi:ribosomal protein L34
VAGPSARGSHGGRTIQHVGSRFHYVDRVPPCGTTAASVLRFVTFAALVERVFAAPSRPWRVVVSGWAQLQRSRAGRRILARKRRKGRKSTRIPSTSATLSHILVTRVRIVRGAGEIGCRPRRKSRNAGGSGCHPKRESEKRRGIKCQPRREGFAASVPLAATQGRPPDRPTCPEGSNRAASGVVPHTGPWSGLRGKRGRWERRRSPRNVAAGPAWQARPLGPAQVPTQRRARHPHAAAATAGGGSAPRPGTRVGPCGCCGWRWQGTDHARFDLARTWAALHLHP